MRMIVASTRAQQQILKMENPDDLVVCVGDRVSGHQVTEIINETHMVRSVAEWERDQRWWEHAQCRVLPA